jgi:hypothetical protein
VSKKKGGVTRGGRRRAKGTKGIAGSTNAQVRKFRNKYGALFRAVTKS